MGRVVRKTVLVLVWTCQVTACRTMVAMALKAKYTQPLQVVATPEMRAEIVQISEEQEVSQAQVIRELIQLGLEARRGVGRV